MSTHCGTTTDVIEVNGQKLDWCSVCREIVSPEPWEFKPTTIHKVNDPLHLGLSEWRAWLLIKMLKYAKLDPSCVDALTPDTYCNAIMLNILRDGLKAAGLTMTEVEERLNRQILKEYERRLSVRS